MPATALLMAPGLKAAVPLVNQVLAGVEDLADRVQLVERRLAALDQVPAADVIRTLTGA